MNETPYNQRSLFPALCELSYVDAVDTTTDYLDTETTAIELTLNTSDPPASIFNDITDLAKDNQIIRTASVGTILSVDRDAKRAYLVPTSVSP